MRDTEMKGCTEIHTHIHIHAHMHAMRVGQVEEEAGETEEVGKDSKYRPKKASREWHRRNGSKKEE